MSNFKNALIAHNPVLFLTFDGDPYESVDRTLTSVPAEFQDESGWANHGMLHEDSATIHNYRMGLPSIVDIDQTDQKSISFGWYGVNMAHPGRWTKSFIEVSHQDQYNFGDNDQHGSFAVSFMFQRDTNEQAWRDIEYANGGAWTSTLVRHKIRKAAVIDIWFQDNWVVADRLMCQHPGGTMQWDWPTWAYGAHHHCVFVWDVKEIEEDIYEAWAKLYLNGRIIMSQKFDYTSSVPNTSVTSPWEIAGTINSGGVASDDRQTSKLVIDQIAVFDKSLSDDEVAHLHRKTRLYDDIVLIAQPSMYYPMDDVASMTDTNMDDLTGNFDGDYIGAPGSEVVREQNAPSQVLGGRSVQFHGRGMAAVHRVQPGTSLYGPMFNLAGDWTVDLWTKFTGDERGVLVSMQRGDAPFEGILIETNRRNDLASPGGIQFTIEAGWQISARLLQDNGSTFFFNDNIFHHVVCLKRGVVTELWIDGVLHATRTGNPAVSMSSPDAGQIYLMGAAPGHLNVTGSLNSVAFYPYALQSQEIKMRTNYSQIYKVRGVITLQGTPYQATVRAFDHRTGTLIQEAISEVDTGDYEITLFDNRLLDIMALNKQDRNVRYRVYGPITPAIYEDVP